MIHYYVKLSKVKKVIESDEDNCSRYAALSPEQKGIKYI